jgi:NAD(P)H-dependent flavin oxidoreductase YrpB (nitropropane dioxygenase family)
LIVLRTRLCELLGLEHPIVMGGMGTGTSPELVAAVSSAGGLGILGASRQSAEELARDVAAIRAATDRPFGLNLLLFRERPGQYDGLLAARPRVISTAWSTLEQDLGTYVARAHAIGALAMHMVSTVAEAKAAARAGVDIIVAQGTEGGGHVGVMGTLPLVPMIVSAVAPIPVLAAGGVADGRGLAAALALGAEGVLLGTRFLATDEAPIAKGFKQAILESDGHDTVVTDIPDVANGQVWPGAYVRVRRNRFIEQWVGREGELRRRRREVSAQLQEAAQAGDPDRGAIMLGQTAGLIDRVEPAADLVRQISRDAESILRDRLPRLLA